MTLTDRAVLELDIEDDDGDTRTGVFVFREDLADATTINREHLLARRGQLMTEAWDIGTDLLDIGDDVFAIDSDARRGYYVDAGTGHIARQLSFRAGYPDDDWGDGSDDDKYDATGSNRTHQKSVIEWYVSQVRADSRGSAELHIDEWCDDTHAEVAGAFAEPLPVAITEATVSKDGDDPGGLEITLEVEWAATVPADDLRDAVDDTLDELAEIVPDF